MANEILKLSPICQLGRGLWFLLHLSDLRSGYFDLSNLFLLSNSLYKFLLRLKESLYTHSCFNCLQNTILRCYSKQSYFLLVSAFVCLSELILRINPISHPLSLSTYFVISFLPFNLTMSLSPHLANSVPWETQFSGS